ncbi:hypothetical protein [Salegentibacter maritimus]|uniref:hypothetical protein n=1 Tax=Salegentibacter maritimus TaxID=2794347 RepID=UPI0018E4C577|nr:hypothetical protein [Salegentibacter maritimus]MBI6117944.1 hypothetical protein [Salegentibacter maritimus]
MNDKESGKIVVTRKELYNLVWGKPLTSLIKDYAYSDNGLRKICKKHNIPTPKLGHWAKLKHGKRSPKVPLPKSENINIELILRKDDENTFVHSNSELAKIKNELQHSGLNFTVPDRISAPHPLVKKAKEILKNRKIGWFGKGRDIIYSQGECLATEVTKPNIPRALRLWNTLIKIILQRGHKISENKNSEFLIDEEKFTLRVREILKRVKVEDSRWERFEMVGSGIMSIKIGHGYGAKEWRDQKDKKLEVQILNIIAKLEHLAYKERTKRIERQEIWEKIEEEEAIKKAREEKVTTELNNFKHLFDTAGRWHRSQYLRNYINEFERHAVESNSLDSHKRDWIAWAKEKADWYDPFIEKEVDLLSEIDRETLNKRKSEF